MASFVGVSQEKNSNLDVTYEKINILSNEKEIVQLTGAKNQPSNTFLTSNSFAPDGSTTGETPGSLSVSLTGGAQYSIPIAVPPGINGVVPEISLEYNSQSGNGLAGYGWNINGISTISRIPATKIHDNEIDGVNFNALDRFALDGQRLIIKNGTYGENGAEYQTEAFSNLKIKSFGDNGQGMSGPSYFIIYYPDGSLARYGHEQNAKRPMSYSIDYWENPQGVRISYEYASHSDTRNAQLIKKIKYGGLTYNNAINEIIFEYENRKIWEESCINGKIIQRKALLKNIVISSNGSKYRSYELSHEISRYSRLLKLQEKSGDQTQSHHPIVFNYSNTTPSVTFNNITTDLTLNNISQTSAETLALDFTGNGKMDFIAYPKNKSKFWLFSDIENGTVNGGSTVNSGTFETVFPSKYLYSNNKIIQKDALTLVKNSSNNKVNFETYTSTPSQPIYKEHTKVWNAPTYSYDNAVNNTEQRRVPQDYVSGDFNGDGLTDVLAIAKPYMKRTCKELPPSECDGPQELQQLTDNDLNAKPPCISCKSYWVNSPRAIFINLKRDITTNFSNHSGTLQLPLKGDYKLYTGDFNGDGKTDILHVTNGKLFVYTLNKNNLLQLLWKTDDSDISISRPLYIGDYNNDGKTDFLHPRYNTSKSFRIYISMGNTFSKGTKNMPFAYQTTNWNGNNGVMSGFNLIPADINGDGKTDIIEYKTTTYNTGANGKQVVKVYKNSGIYSSTSSAITYSSSLRFEYDGGTSKTGNLTHFPIPIFLTSNLPNKNLSFASISNNKITSFVFNKDHRKEVLIRSIENNGVKYEIKYSGLDPKYTGSYPDVYKYSNTETYPYGSLSVAPGTKVVTELKRISEGSPTLRQQYSYYDAIYHTGGLGFLGFKGIAQSNWHTDSTDRIFNIALYDHTKRGALSAQYSMKNLYSFTVPTSGYINKTVYENTYTLGSNKVYKLSTQSSLTQNAINGTYINRSYLYDAYNNPKKITINHSGNGSTVTDITYIHNSSADYNYYIGRVAKELETLTIEGDVFKTSKEFEYSEHLVSKLKHYGNGTPADVEAFTYDNFGNLKTKTITPNNSNSRVVRYEYDNSGRFLKKTTNIEGLETLYDYNVNAGTLTKKTNAYGHVTRFEYDAWLRPTKVIDHLGKQLKTTYSDEQGHKHTIKTIADDNSESIALYDRLKRVEEVKEKDVTGQWIATRYQYDKFDRVKKQSEPFIDGTSPTQWNETTYDVYGRPTKQTLYTGKVINISYNDLSVTVNDGTKTVKTTKDAIGNTISVTDPGGTINYKYYGSGNLKTANYNGVIVSLEQDNWGRKKKLTDPSAGVYQYEYNGFGEITKEKTPKGETNYTYSTIGKLEKKTIIGDDTDIKVLYNYNSTSKVLDKITMTNADGNHSTYNYTYDNLYRIKETEESNPYAKFTKSFTYDGFGRVSSEKSTAKLLANNKTSTNTILHNYENGTLKSMADRFSGKSLWNISSVNARGQATAITMHNSLSKESTYGPLGDLKEHKVINNGGFVPVEMMKLTTEFNVQRGTLNKRTSSLFSWSETFEYDDLDRLIDFNDNDGNNNHTYDNLGRITKSNTVGDYKYASNSYQVKDIELNTQGDLYYQNNPLEQVSYNAFKKPVKIKEKGKDLVHFKYNAFMGRAHRFYGSTEDDISTHTKSKHYSFDGSMEISHDKTSEKTTFVTYIGGDAYSAPAIWRSEQKNNNSVEDYYYLYRDYLGSIVMISDKDGAIKEKRHFDAWGNIVKVADGNNNELEQLTFIDRGYTGHEHLQGVNLIHMNGRLYDPKLKRFLAPDNYIQDITNTQNFNRYGYVLNNPLMYTDPSGEMTVYGPESGGPSTAQQAGLGAIIGSLFLVDWKSVSNWFGTNFKSAKKDVKGFFNKWLKPFKDKQAPLVNYENTEVITQDPLAGSSANTSNAFYAGGGTDVGGLGVRTGPRHMLSQATNNNYGPWYYRWGNSENILASFSYGLVNDAFQVVQTLDGNLIPSGGINPLKGGRSNLNINGTPNYNPSNGFINTISNLIPSTRGIQGLKSILPKGLGYLRKINASQFSKLFKGNLAKLAPSFRGKVNKVINSGVDYLNNQIANGMALLHSLKLKEKEEEDKSN